MKSTVLDVEVGTCTKADNTDKSYANRSFDKTNFFGDDNNLIVASTDEMLRELELNLDFVLFCIFSFSAILSEKIESCVAAWKEIICTMSKKN